MRATFAMTCTAAALTTLAGVVAARINHRMSITAASLSVIAGLLPWCFIGSFFYHFNLPQAVGVIGLYLPAPVFLLAIVVSAVGNKQSSQQGTVLSLIVSLCMALLFTITMFDLLCQME